jgi:hypothetical protein
VTSFASTTDDDGTASQVRATEQGDEFVVKASATAETVKGCVMRFAYWNPAFLTQTRLLNAQTGKLESVQIQRVGSGSVEVRGKPLAATEFRITGLAESIIVWYSAQGEWVRLDSTVAGGRTLSCRLE